MNAQYMLTIEDERSFEVTFYETLKRAEHERDCHINEMMNDRESRNHRSVTLSKIISIKNRSAKTYPPSTAFSYENIAAAVERYVEGNR